jgi:hypothetical protein
VRTLGPAFDKIIYDTPATVKAVLQTHAKVNGYAIFVHSSTPTRVVYVCSKSSNRDATWQVYTIYSGIRIQSPGTRYMNRAHWTSVLDLAIV